MSFSIIPNDLKAVCDFKIAQTVDGFLTAANGDSQWITGKAAEKKYTSGVHIMMP